MVYCFLWYTWQIYRWKIADKRHLFLNTIISLQNVKDLQFTNLFVLLPKWWAYHAKLQLRNHVKTKRWKWWTKVAKEKASKQYHKVVKDVPFAVPSHVQVSARQLTSVVVRNRGLTLLHVNLSDFKLAEGANLHLLVQAYRDNRKYKVWCTRYTIKLSCCSTHLMANKPSGYHPTRDLALLIWAWWHPPSRSHVPQARVVASTP